MLWLILQWRRPTQVGKLFWPYCEKTCLQRLRQMKSVELNIWCCLFSYSGPSEIPESCREQNIPFTPVGLLHFILILMNRLTENQSVFFLNYVNSS